MRGWTSDADGDRKQEGSMTNRYGWHWGRKTRWPLENEGMAQAMGVIIRGRMA